MAVKVRRALKEVQLSRARAASHSGAGRRPAANRRRSPFVPVDRRPSSPLSCVSQAGACFAYTLFGLSWLSWIVMLGGVAGMQVRWGCSPYREARRIGSVCSPRRSGLCFLASLQAKCGGYLGRILFPIPGDTNSAVFEDCSTTNTTAFIW